MDDILKRFAPNLHGEGVGYYVDGELGAVPLVSPHRNAERVAEICRQQNNPFWEIAEHTRHEKAAEIEFLEPTDTSPQPHAG